MTEPDRCRQQRFAAIYDAHWRDLTGYALRRTLASEDAADAVADTFLVAWRRLDEVPADPDARPWLFGVARRVLANQRRGSGRRERLGERLRAHLDQNLPPNWDETTAARLTVRRAMAQLDDDDRELLQLVHWEGLSPSELATAMDIPPATVRTRLHRARRRLRDILMALTNDPARPDR